MLRNTPRHLVAATALAFLGSTLAGSIVGLPSALAASGIGSQVDGRGLAQLDPGTVTGTAVVAGGASFTAASVIGTAKPVQVVTSLPATAAAAAAAAAVTAPTATTLTTAALGIPAPLLDAYKKAAALKNQQSPTCQIDWSLLAAIGKVESNHAQGGKVDAAGNTRGGIQGPATAYGTAKGPMQFIDSSWVIFGADGNGDGVKNVNNIYDAALGAANHLCSSGKGSLKDPQHLHDAIYGYNHAEWYVAQVIQLMNSYSGGAVAVPAASGDVSTTPVTTTPVTTTTGGSGGGTGDSGSTGGTGSAGGGSSTDPTPTPNSDSGQLPTLAPERQVKGGKTSSASPTSSASSSSASPSSTTNSARTDDANTNDANTDETTTDDTNVPTMTSTAG